ncbi:hypothetical protein Cme02nite_04880 [Catellatospora methionotrophica]|uniref:Uncharacterized protein n=1 Tax=Catellatospora methionotrophica TaxID=121620 RepID=A0A8J3LBU4_9ACTN|nr:DUF6000 family protein [Catellatospora methionotrophica]GIG12156.1 hypothetical protein Cme02nite_04880 [Catellatospora methionotrophica]
MGEASDLTAAHAPFRPYVMGPGQTDRRYLKLLGGGSFVDNLPDGQAAEMMRGLWVDARRITDGELTAMLLLRDWRPRLSAAWLIGLDLRTRFRDRLGELLLESGSAHAGKGYAFALARFAEPADIGILTGYLERYLPTDLPYDQGYVLAVLLDLDSRLGTDHAARFVDPAGPWWRNWLPTDGSTGFGDRVARVYALAEATSG